MTDREFFIETLADELPRFQRAFAAVPTQNLDYRPDPKSRTAKEIVETCARESGTFEAFLTTGVIDFASVPQTAFTNIDEATNAFVQNMNKGQTLISNMAEADWQSPAVMKFGDKVEWETTRGKMAWGLLLDEIHHRGQLSTYIRPMGGKVPSIYGPSADSA